MKTAICDITKSFFEDDPTQRFTAVLFRNTVYVASPRHLDAVNLAFKGMTPLQIQHVSLKIENGKEKMLFGKCFR